MGFADDLNDIIDKNKFLSQLSEDLGADSTAMVIIQKHEDLEGDYSLIVHSYKTGNYEKQVFLAHMLERLVDDNVGRKQEDCDHD